MREAVIILTLWFLVCAPGLAGAADGDLDPSFGGTGVVTVPFADVKQRAGGMTIQPDGKIVVAGLVASTSPGSGTVALARFDGAGNPDAGFGSGGLATTTLTGHGANVAIHPNGSLYVLRIANDILLSRFTSTGDLDLTFGIGGTVTTDCGGSETAASRGDLLLVQPDGKLVVGATRVVGMTYDACLVRYEADGTPDGTFATGGVAVVPDFYVTDLAFQTDGAVLVGGIALSTAEPVALGVARVTSAGLLDAGFGVAGLVTREDFGLAYAIASQPDGRVVVLTLGTQSQMTLIRYRADGSPDTSFGDDGVAATTLVGSAEHYEPVDLALQGDGKILAGLIVPDGNGPPGGSLLDELAMARFEHDGAPDASYGVGGLAETGVLGQMTTLRVQGDGKAVVVGSRASFGPPWTISRLLAFSNTCPAAPAVGCKTTVVPGAAQLKVRNLGIASKKNVLQWKWKGDATTLADLGDPIGGDDYAFCVYDGGTLVSQAVVPGGGSCRNKPCWRSTGTTGLGYSDSGKLAFGIGIVKLKAGAAGAAQIQVKAQGPSTAPPSLPLGSPVLVQLTGETGACWEAVYSAPTKNDGVSFQAKSD